MRSKAHGPELVSSTLLLLGVALLAGTVHAQVASTTAAPADPSSPTRFEARNHHASMACGKRWLKHAKQLSQRQLAWMLATDHQIHAVQAGGRTVLTLEVLSTASFRDCDVRQHWSQRETTARVTSYRPDGSTKVRLIHFAQDDIFFNRQPRIYSQLGRALLTGVTVDGESASRWVSLPELASIPRPDRSPAPRATVRLAAH